MKYAFKRRLYEALPPFLRAPTRWLPFDWLAGASYRAVLSRGRSLDRALREEVVSCQDGRLENVLTYVSEQVPAYRNLKTLVGHLAPREALKAFPLLDKEALQTHMQNYLPRDFDRIPHYECTTGGTSGNQLRLHLDNDSQAVEMGFMHRQWARVGYTPRSRKATFRGVEFRDLPDRVYWQENPIYNEMQFSPYHMNEQTLGSYLNKMSEYRPQFLHGYPSAISLLADYILRHEVDWKALNIKAALLGSEAVTSEQRAMIEKAFHTRVFSWYGHSERVILAGECEYTTDYHTFPDYGYLEILKENGEPAEEGEMGEIVGTGFLNRSLPLIRYRTGDMARRLRSECKCGRWFDRFTDVEGRWKQEYVIGKNGSRMSMAALNIHGAALDRVVRYQYFQNRPGVMELRVMVVPGFGESDVVAISTAFADKMGDELMVEVKVVEDIPLTGRGKLRRLVQETPAGSRETTGR